MTSRARLALLAAAVVVLVAAFLVLRDDGSGGDDAPSATAQPSRTTTDAHSPDTAEAAPGGAEAPPAAPAIPVVRLRDGRPVGGVRRLTFAKGERIRFAVVSDAAGDAHLHGYDVERQLTPGARARFDLRATLEGRFELELHGTDTQLARLDVTP